MNANHIPSGAHIADLLPLYVNGALDAAERERVRTHLGACDECAAELAAWQAVAGATQTMVAATPSVAQSAPALLAAVWARIDALNGVAAPAARMEAPNVAGAERAAQVVPASMRAAPAPSGAHHAPGVAHAQPRTWLTAAWVGITQWAQMTLAQARLIHIGLWVASALCVAGVTLYAALAYQGGLTMLSVALPMIAAAGAAFIYGREADPALEVALATPASPRAILLSRVGLVFGYDVALGLMATAIVALTHGENVASAVTLWLGPSALLASGALLLSLLLGPLVSVVSAAGVWLTQFVQLQNAGGASDFHLTLDPLWGANWPTLALAAVLLLLAVIYAPRQERLT
ncbi:MAG TPA: zf-HC2 domain-containing protein [Ktedonobacterales bacterium]|nr:zf-HC2 domain-containing protein [Ktedonobacterales bacterium]